MEWAIMTFNIRIDTKEDGENAWGHRKLKVIECIETHQPDLLSIQEASYEMMKELSSYFTDYDWIGQGREGANNGEFNAILYKKNNVELLQQGQFWLSETPAIPGSISWNSACSRICTWGIFKKSNASPIYLYNTHLDHESLLARKKGIEVLCTYMQPAMNEEYPVVLTGDLNSNSQSKIIDVLEHNGLIRLKTNGKTYHGFKGGISGQPIDYIFISNCFLTDKIYLDRERYQAGYPSDHYPVIAQIQQK